MEAWKSHVKNLRNFTNGTLPAVLSLLHLSLLNFRVTILPPFFSFFSLIYLITWTRWNFVKHTCKCTNRWKRPSCPTESQRSSLSFFSLLSTWKKTNETISMRNEGFLLIVLKMYYVSGLPYVNSRETPCENFPCSKLERGKKLFSYFFTRVCVYTRVVISTGLKTGLLYRFLFVTFSRYGILRIEFFSLFFFFFRTDWNSNTEREKEKRTYVTMGINRDNFMYDFYYRGLINSMFSN